MLTRRSATSMLASLVLATMVSAPALAGEPSFQTYTPAAFEAAKAAGKPILVAIHAVWCGTCKIQRVILNDLIKQPEFKDLVVLRVDFDDQKDAVTGFGADSQSTLIVYKGKTEITRTVGDTSGKRIEAMLRSAI